ncbi:MAG: cytidylate kinase-like family protein [Candidatus Cloacimonetes bacterium]|nr:cytidylate kinase-like family protein [Candidatus Cloacimonadota bacterium]
MHHKDLNLEALVRRQARLLELQDSLRAQGVQNARFITISREVGCAGIRLGLGLQEAFNEGQPESAQWAVYDRKVFEAMEGDPELTRRLFEDAMHERPQIEAYLYTTFGVRPEDLFLFRRWSMAIRRLAEAGNCILVGRGAHLVTRDLPGALHLRVVAPFDWRVRQVQESHHLDPTLAHALTRRRDKERRQYLEHYFDRTDLDLSDSDLVLNNARVSLEEMITLLLSLCRSRGLLAD